MRTNPLVVSLLALGLALASPSADAVTRSWPGGAPCAGTLQACIDASAAADTVQIVTNTPITESLFLPRSLTLEGGIGFSAQMAVGFSIEGSSTDANPYNIAIRRIALTNAHVAITHNLAGTANIEIRRVRIESTSASTNTGIQVFAGSGGDATVRISDNYLQVAGTFKDHAGVEVRFTGNSGSALVDFNHLEAAGNFVSGWGSGILAWAIDGATPTVTVINNEVRGRFGEAAIGIFEFGSTPGTVTARVIGNAVSARLRQDGQVGGIRHGIKDGSINTQVINNTVVGTSLGMKFARFAAGSAGTGSISGPVQNNLIAFNRWGLFVQSEFASPVQEDYNLVFGNQLNDYTPGANDVIADPKLRSLTDLRLQTGSPAINQGNSFALLLFPSSIGLVDADGLRRFKESVADIGAYEFGDFSLRARALAPSNNHFAINQPLVDGNPNARLLVTPCFDGVADPQPIGGFYPSAKWRIFNQSPPAAAMPVGAAFNVFAPADADGAFVHTATAANTSGHVTTIDNTALNNLPNQIVLATANWNPGGAPGIYNPHTTSVGYFSTRWFVLNNDFGAMPDAAAFNIYAQPPSPNAYVHAASSANSLGNETSLDHPLLNGMPCALVHITPRTTAVDSTFDVDYDVFLQRWTIFNHSAPMAIGAEFNVVIDAGQVAACAGVLFGDDFED